MKHVNRYVPELAFSKINSLLEINEPCFKYEKEVFYFLIDLFYRLPTYNKNIKYTDSGMITISSKYFSKYITKGYSKYTNWLIKHNIIQCDRIKKVGKAYGYQLCPCIISKLMKINISSSTIIAKRIIDNFNRRKKHHRKLPEHIKQMKSHFKKEMRVNLDEGLKYLENQLKNDLISMNQYNVSVISLHAIDDKELYFKINSTNGRIDSNITNLKSELRKYIIGEYKHIDCQNSQPLIINFITKHIETQNQINVVPNILDDSSLEDDREKILSKELTAKDLNYLKFFPNMNKKALKEFEKFSADTFNSDFYSTIMADYEKLYGKMIDRKEVKEIIYKVFFSKNWSYKEEKKIFKKLYPTIYSIIYNLKRVKHNRFAICLQRIESEIFIQRICKCLVEEGIIPFTIHDSIIVIEQYKDRSIEIMKQVYNDMMNKIPNFICSEL